MMAGHPRNFKTEKEVLDLWNEFKARCDSTPYYEEVATNKGVMKVARRKPYTKQGFMAFVYNKTGKHISQYLDNSGGFYDEYISVVTHIKNEWEEDQICGTFAGVYKAPNLTARLNGLAEKTENKNTHEVEIFKGIDLDVRIND